MSAADIEVDLKNLSISTTGISYTGYSIYLRHRGTADIDLDMDNVVVLSSGLSAEAIYLVHNNTGDISVDMNDVTVWTRGNSADGLNPLHYGNGDLTVRMRGSSITTTAQDSQGIWAALQGNTGKLTIDVKDSAITTMGVGYSNDPYGVRSYDLATGGTDITLSNTSVRTLDAAAVYALRIGRLGEDGEKGDLNIDLTDVTLATTGAGARHRRGHTVSKAGVHAKDTGVGDMTVNFRSGSIRTIGVTGYGLQIEQGENADADGGPHTDGGWSATHGAGSVTAAVGAEASMETPFSSGVHALVGNPKNATGRIVLTHEGSIEAGVAGLSAWAARWSGSTFGEGTQAADDAARTEPMIRITSSGNIAAGASVTDGFVRAAIAGADGEVSDAEQAVLDAIADEDSDALETALEALPAAYDDAWKARAQAILVSRTFEPTNDSELLVDAADKALSLPSAGIRALVHSHTRITAYVAKSDVDPALASASYWSLSFEQRQTLDEQRRVSDAERPVVAAVLAGGEGLEALLAALPSASEEWKNEVRRLATLYNAGDVRVDVTGGKVVSDGDGVQVRYILAHDRNGTVTVNVSEGAEIVGGAAGIHVQGAGMGGLGKDTPLGRALRLTADETNLRRQFVTVHGKVTGGTDAAVHLASGGTLVVGETGELIAGSSGRVVLVNDPGRAIVVIHGLVRGDEGADAAVHLTGGGAVTVGLTGRVEANGADAAIRGDARTAMTVHTINAGDPVAIREAAARVKGTIRGEGVGESVAFAEVNPETGRTTGNVADIPLDDEGMLELPAIPPPPPPSPPPPPKPKPGAPKPEPGAPKPEPAPVPTRFDCGLAEDRRCRLYEALPSVLLAMNRMPTHAERASAPRGEKGGWARVETVHGEWAAARASSTDDEELAYDYGLTGARAGFDFEASGARVGFSVHALHGKAKIGGVGEIAADGKGAGASATWTFGDFWLDAQAQATWLEAEVDSAASGKLEKDATGKSLALGLEAGRRTPIAGGAFLTPRLGFSWTSADLGDFTDSIRPTPTRVSLEEARSARGRAGVTLDAPVGDGRLFGALDVEREFSDETSMEVSDVKLETKVEATTARVGLGGAFPLFEEAASLHISAHYAASGGDASEYGATVNVSMGF